MNERSVLTLATGKPYFVELAINLARSFLYWHKDECALPFYLVTDREDLIPNDVRRKIQVIPVRAQQFGDGFSAKLSIDQLAKTSQTLFIDADCLVYGSLQPLFSRFEGQAVSVIGEVITEGEFFGDIGRIRRQLNLDYMVRFVGAVYYLESGEISSKVFERARELRPDYDALGLVRLRGKENEEPLLSIAMATYHQKPVSDDGSLKADVMCYTKAHADVLKGAALLENSPDHFPNWVRIERARPVIVHYNCSYAEGPLYKAESLKLKKVMGRNWHPSLARLLALFTIILPSTLVGLGKNIFRSAYRRLFGVRRIKPSPRM